MVVVRACLARVGERGKESAQQARAAVTTLTHKSATGNPLSPQPRDRPVLLTAIQGRTFPQQRRPPTAASLARATAGPPSRSSTLSIYDPPPRGTITKSPFSLFLVPKNTKKREQRSDIRT